MTLQNKDQTRKPIQNNEGHYFYRFPFICHICLVKFATRLLQRIIYVERTREEHVNNATVVEEMKTRKCLIFINMFNSSHIVKIVFSYFVSQRVREKRFFRILFFIK